MRKLAATADKYQAKHQLRAGGPTFGRKRVQVKAEREAPVRMAAKPRTFKTMGQADPLLNLDRIHELLRPFERDFWAQADWFRMPRVPAPRMYMNKASLLAINPPAARPAPGDGPVWQDERHYERATCDLPPTDCPVELARRDTLEKYTGPYPSVEAPRDVFKRCFQRRRLKRLNATVAALHAVMDQRGAMLGKGVSRTVYSLGKHTVLKVPCRASLDNIGANILELRMWKKHRRRATIKLAACRKIMILGVPCLIMQRVRVPGRNDARKGDTRVVDAPPWALRLDGYQCALTSRGEWVAYDYGFQREEEIIEPLRKSEIEYYERRTSKRMGEAAE